MKTKGERIANTIKIVFVVSFLLIVAFFVVGEAIMPNENPTKNAQKVLFEANWERVFSNGIRQSIDVPGQCVAETGEVVRIETVLPDNQIDTWLCMRASQQNMRIYVGDTLRQEYNTENTRLFGKNSVSAYVFFKLVREDAGKVLSIETVSEDPEYTGFLNEIYVGDKIDIIYNLVKSCSVVLLISLFMFILGSVTVVAGLTLKYVYKRRVDITYLGWGVLLLSMNMLVESTIRQFFLPNSSIAAHIGFLFTIILPYPFMVYVNKIQAKRYEIVYNICSIVLIVNLIVSIMLQLFNIVDLAESMVVSYGMIIIVALIILSTICIDVIRKKIREYGEVIWGLIAMGVVAIWEVMLTFMPETPYHGGVALSIGLLVLLLASGFKTARDLLTIEKEKQVAIIAGESKAKFIANMSHEIRTPINTIIGMNEMILRENKDEAVEEYAKSVQNASKLLLGLINDILDFSKIEAGKMDILETDYHLSKMLTDVIKGIKIKADSKKLDMKLDIDEALPSVLMGDEIRIRQIMNNLLSNAVKYTHSGSITLSVQGVRTGESFILCMSVKDTGMGIKDEDLNKLFESFQRLEEKKNRYIEGTGLGLNITKQLVELMGGVLEVESEYRKGSCFTVKIPQNIIDEKPIGKLEDAYNRDSSEKIDVKPKLYAPKAEILVVDDNRMNLAVVKALLKRTGIKLTMVNGGKECLDICREHQYDLILMDHMMPEPDGIETLQLLRKDDMSLNQHTDVIVLTANAIAGMAEMYIEKGFIDYLSKPIVSEKLEAMISKYLPIDKIENGD